jgi:anaerobic sulfite reductase subunit B
MCENAYLTEPLKLISIRKETEIDFTFKVEYNKPLLPGQFLELSIPGVGEAPISVSDFGDGYLDLTIRKVGRVTEQIFEMRPGDVIYARGPYGNGFDCKLYENKDLIVVAGGTGLAPVKNLINRFVSNKGLLKSFTLIIGFKSPEDILFADEIRQWESSANVCLTVDRATGDWKGRTGLVTKYIEELEIGDPASAEAIVVGPPMMMKFAVLGLMKKNLPKQNIWVSFERKMACGIGKCGHCKIDDTYICLDGPVFNYTKAEKLLD